MGTDKIRQTRFNDLTDTESLSVPVNFKLEINFSTSTGETSDRNKEHYVLHIVGGTRQ